MRSKIHALSFIVISLIFWVPTLLYAQEDEETINEIRILNDDTILLSDFEQYPTGELPFDWYSRNGLLIQEEMPEDEQQLYQYSVEGENGNKFLRYEGSLAKHLNFPLVGKNVNIYENPILSWQWRVFDLPEGANEDSSDLNDTAASIYVVFDFGRVLFRKVPKSIRYTWSTTLEEGTELSAFFGNQKIVVMESGDENVGSWQSFERNIVEDYKRLFGDDPPENPLAVLILSDGDSTDSFVKADYDNIMLKPLVSQ